MLTPCFEVNQDDVFIIIKMRVPFAKTAELEFCIEGNCFKFYCKPYFLRLCLPGELVEDGQEKAEHDIDKGTVTVYVPKLHGGQYFKNLGMITALLSKKPPTKKPHGPLIEVLPGAAVAGDETAEEEEEEFDWQVDQLVPDDEKELHLGTHSLSHYGFAGQQTGVFSKLQDEFPALVDCPAPDQMTPHERRVARLAHEEASFDPQHYLADLMEGSEVIESVCKLQPPWSQQLVSWTHRKNAESTTADAKRKREPDQDLISFTDEEKMQLKELPNKELQDLLDKAAQKALYLGLVDIVFAYAYDCRITEYEHNVESAWNICKLSSTLSWLEVFRGSVGEVVYCSARRCLCYPLYRHWQLVQCVLQDIAHLFLLGRRKLLQCLLDVRQILNSSEPYYIMNNLYITDYCIWLQTASARQIQSLALELKQVKLERRSMGWELGELEEAAHLVAAEATTSSDTHSTESEGETSSGADQDGSEDGETTSEGDLRSEGEAQSDDGGTRKGVSGKEKLKSRVPDISEGRSEGRLVCEPANSDQGSKTAATTSTSDTAGQTVGFTATRPALELLGATHTITQTSTDIVNEEHGDKEDLGHTPSSSCTAKHLACEDGSVEGLSERVRDLLTLQPVTQSTVKSPTQQKLIQELN